MPWLTLVILAISVIEFRNFVPHGVIPMMLILCGLPFVGMCIMIAAALVGESEGWGIAANVLCQSSYGLAWYFLNRTPVLHNNSSTPKPVWDSLTLHILGGQLVLILVILALTYFLQSRKRDFVSEGPRGRNAARQARPICNMKGNAMRYVCLLALLPSFLFGQDGASIYKERCASCHDAPRGRVPAIATIKQMSPEASYMALTSGVMKSRAEGLATLDVMTLIAYIAPTGGAQPVAAIEPTCKTPAVFRPGTASPQWNGWSTSLSNSRFQDKAAAALTAVNVPRLKLKWAFNLGEVTIARGQPVVVGGRVFVTSQTGVVYALDADSGCTRWGVKPGGAIRSGVAFGDADGKPAIFLGDGPNVYALNADTGEQIWKVKAADHFSAMATATPRYYNGVIYQPYSSFEEALGPDPNFECCTFRGSVVALDAATGKRLWQTFTIAETPKPTRKNAGGKQMYGPSGAGVWSTPTIDEQRGVLYVATGDNYSDPTTATSDAVLAIDLKRGELLWSKQVTQSDAYNNGCVVPGGTNCPNRRDRITISVSPQSLRSWAAANVH